MKTTIILLSLIGDSRLGLGTKPPLRLKRTVILLSILLLFNFAKATIRHTYVNQFIPVFSYCDMDNNGQNDFRLYYDTHHLAYFIEGLDTTSYFAVDAQNHVEAYSLGSYMGVFAWNNGIADLSHFMLNTKYLMVKFNNGADTHYGWFLINTNTDNSGGRLVVSYAYNDEPDQTMYPGEGQPGQPIAIDEVFSGSFKIQVQNGLIHILNPGNYVASIISVNGQTVLQQQVIGGKIDSAMLPKGIYVLTLTDEKGRVANRKIVL